MSALEKFNETQIALILQHIAETPVLNAQPLNSDGAFVIAKELNKLAEPEFWVWNSQTPVADVYNAITWESFTPNWSPGTASPETQITMLAKVVWALLVTIQQINLQNIFLRFNTIDATLPNIRKGISDSLSKLPSGAQANPTSAPGNQNAGSVPALNAMRRRGSVLEKILTTTQPVGNAGVTAYVPGFDILKAGVITTEHIVEIRNA